MKYIDGFESLSRTNTSRFKLIGMVLFTCCAIFVSHGVVADGEDDSEPSIPPENCIFDPYGGLPTNAPIDDYADEVCMIQTEVVQ